MAVVGRGYQQQQSFGTSGGLGVPAVCGHPLPAVSVVMASAGPERPASALARGIQITEFKDARVNPEPEPLEESDILLEEYLSPRKLKALTGMDNLHDVHYLEMKVDTRDTSLGNFGTHLPHLSQLKLSNSLISTVRDLGSSLNALRVLWMARCGVEDLDGLSSMNSLKELYLAYNDICDISPCSLLENLVTLDLEGNNIDEMSQVHFLNTCLQLRNLTLEGNPVCVTPSPDQASPNYNYRKSVKQAIPHLELLDDEPLVTGEDSDLRRTASVFEDDWALIDELLEEGTIAGSDDSLDVSAPRPTTSLRPTTGYRPGSALKNYMGTGLRPGTRAGRPGTATRPGTRTGRPGTSSRLATADTSRSGSARPGTSSGRPPSSEDQEVTEDASDLTRGGVFCGNPSKALRSRHKPQSPQNKSAAMILAKMKFKPEHTYDTSHEEESDMKELLEELQEWRQSYSVKQKVIDESKTAQVLTISHDDGLSMSEDEETSQDSEEDIHPQPNAGFTEQFSRSNGYSITSGAAKDTKSVAKSRTRSSRTRSRSKGPYDESFDAPEEGSTSKTPEEQPQKVRLHGRSPHHVKSSSAEQLRAANDPSPKSTDKPRPLSNPIIGTKGKLRLGSPVDKTKPKTIDPLNPIVRASVHSPEARVPDGPRADTAKAIFPTPPPASRMRKGLANVPLLPSKFTK